MYSKKLKGQVSMVLGFKSSGFSIQCKCYSGSK